MDPEFCSNFTTELWTWDMGFGIFETFAFPLWHISTLDDLFPAAFTVGSSQGDHSAASIPKAHQPVGMRCQGSHHYHQYSLSAPLRPPYTAFSLFMRLCCHSNPWGPIPRPQSHCKAQPGRAALAATGPLSPGLLLKLPVPPPVTLLCP